MLSLEQAKLFCVSYRAHDGGWIKVLRLILLDLLILRQSPVDSRNQWTALDRFTSLSLILAIASSHSQPYHAITSSKRSTFRWPFLKERSKFCRIFCLHIAID